MNYDDLVNLVDEFGEASWEDGLIYARGEAEPSGPSNGDKKKETLLAFIARIQRDALRYRCLRGELDWWDAGIISLYAGPDFDRLGGEELDAAIDEAMQRETR